MTTTAGRRGHLTVADIEAMSDPEVAAEIENRLGARGIYPCRCGDDCTAWTYAAARVYSGLMAAKNGDPRAAGAASMATLGYGGDGKSRRAVLIGRRGGRARGGVG